MGNKTSKSGKKNFRIDAINIEVAVDTKNKGFKELLKRKMREYKKLTEQEAIQEIVMDRLTIDWPESYQRAGIEPGEFANIEFSIFDEEGNSSEYF